MMCADENMFRLWVRVLLMHNNIMHNSLASFSLHSNSILADLLGLVVRERKSVSTAVESGVNLSKFRGSDYSLLDCCPYL